MAKPLVMNKTCDNGADGIPTLATFDEIQATLALGMVPAVGDMRIRVDGPTMAHNASPGYAYEAVGALGAADAYAAVLIGRGDGTWAATDRFGLGRFVLGEGELPEPTGWEPPYADEAPMVTVEEVEALCDEAWEVASSEHDYRAYSRYSDLEMRATAERIAHEWARVTPARGDLLLLIDGDELLDNGGEDLLAPLFAVDATISCEVGLGDGRWAAYDPLDMLDVVQGLRLKREGASQ